MRYFSARWSRSIILTLFMLHFLLKTCAQDWSKAAKDLDPQLKVLFSWTLDSADCSKQGLICSGDTVTKINLAYYNLNGTITSEFSKLSQLQEMDLSHNQFTGSIPSELSNLNNLNTLNLQDNLLTGEIPSSLGNLQNLKTLSLSNNQLSGKVPDGIVTLYKNGLVLSLENNGALCSDATIEFVQTCSPESPPPPLSSPPPPSTTPPPSSPSPPNTPSTVASPPPPLSNATSTVKKSSGGISMALVAGIVAGSIVFILILSLLYCFFCCACCVKRRKKKSEVVSVKNSKQSKALVESKDVELGEKTSIDKKESSSKPPPSSTIIPIKSVTMNHQVQDAPPASAMAQNKKNEKPEHFLVSNDDNNTSDADALLKKDGNIPLENSSAIAGLAISSAIVNSSDSKLKAETGTNKTSDSLPFPSTETQLHNRSSSNPLIYGAAGKSLRSGDVNIETVDHHVDGKEDDNLSMSAKPYPPNATLSGWARESAPSEYSEDLSAVENESYISKGENTTEYSQTLTKTSDFNEYSRTLSGESEESREVSAGKAGRLARDGSENREEQSEEEEEEEDEEEGNDEEEEEEDGKDQLLDKVDRWFTFSELFLATNEFGARSQRNFLGNGRYGSVHKARLPNATFVAVKRLSGNNPEQTEKDFLQEVETMSMIKHTNIVSLLGCCVEGNERILVYEYIHNGSLDKLLHSDSALHFSPLSWKMRIHIALGVAKGIAHLHEGLPMKVVHRDIKSSNVLLDENWNAKVADFALAKLMGREQGHATTRIMGTFGYLAPEYANTGLLTDRSDVYSFGVLLLELITGRKPVDGESKSNQGNLVEWVKNMVREDKAAELLDPRLTDVSKDDVDYVIRCIALHCVESNALKRIKMSKVVDLLQSEDNPEMKEEWIPKPPAASFARGSQNIQTPSLRNYMSSNSPRWNVPEPGSAKTQNSPKAGDMPNSAKSTISPRNSADIGSIIASAALKASSPHTVRSPRLASTASHFGPSTTTMSPRTPSGFQTSPREAKQ